MAFSSCSGLNSVNVDIGNPQYDSRNNCNAIIETASHKLLFGCQNTIIPNNVTNIGESAFYGCSGLTSIDIPNSVTSIGHMAFKECYGLTSVTIGNGLTSIGDNAFERCTSLKSIIVDTDNSIFDSRNNCNAIIETKSNNLIIGCMNTVIPNSVTSIGEFAFYFCSGLTSIVIPNSVTDIGWWAFYGCSGLSSIDIPNSVTDIGENAFYGCSSLTSVTIPNSMTYIGDYVFAGCSSLTSIDIPNSVVSIENSAFFDCTGLTSIIIPNSVTSIGGSAFDGCTALVDVTNLSATPQEIQENVFYVYGTLHVPAGSIDAYRNAEHWKDFKEIVALPATEDYRKMVEDGKVWKTGIYGSGNPVRHVEYFYFDGDTIIDGKACKQMMCQQYYNLDASDDAYNSQLSTLSYVGAWYEEDKKVYTYDTTSKQFVLKYDFSIDANDTLLINQEDYYVIGPRQTGGLRGFKGVYRDVWFLAEEGNPIYSPSWLEGVGSIDGPTVNVYPGYVDPLRFLMSCTVDDEVIYFNDDYEDGATPEELNANKHRFDFTHTVKTQPKAPGMGGEERPKGVASADTQSIYGEYSQQQLSIHLEPLVETYVVCITNESNEVVYEKTINTVGIVGLNIDISTYAKGCYTATVENYYESFVGEFEMQATGNDITLSCPDDNHPHAIDLGLPSGTKWACCNVGASTPEGYGGYYAWGETEEKDYYSLSTYIHYDDSSSTYHDLGSDIAGTQYDVAHVKWGGSWVMPSKDQNQELIENCKYEWIIVNDVMGAQFTGPSGGTIFLPAAGIRSAGDLYYAGSSGYNWSSTQEPPYSYSAYRLYFNWYNAYWSYSDSRGGGLTVRPIISGTNNIILSESLSNASNQAIYNIYGIKVADNIERANNLPSGIYIQNGRKFVR